MPRILSRVQVIDRDIQALLEEASPEEMNKAFRQFAREEIAKAREQNRQVLGQAPDYEIRVGGTPASLNTATTNDIIEALFELSSEMFKWIDDMLILNSPVGDPSDKRPGHPGLYAASHMFFADGNSVDPQGPVPQAEEYVFVNTQPYARKIERGNHSAQAPDGVYQVVAAMAASRFSNFATVRFNYRTPYEFGAIHEWANTTDMQSPYRRGENRDEWLRRQPAIVIVV